MKNAYVNDALVMQVRLLKAKKLSDSEIVTRLRTAGVASELDIKACLGFSEFTGKKAAKEKAPASAPVADLLDDVKPSRK